MPLKVISGPTYSNTWFAVNGIAIVFSTVDSVEVVDPGYDPVLITVSLRGGERHSFLGGIDEANDVNGLLGTLGLSYTRTIAIIPKGEPLPPEPPPGGGESPRD